MRHDRGRSGCAADQLIREKNGQPFFSNDGNIILDWKHGAIDDPAALERQLKSMSAA